MIGAICFGSIFGLPFIAWGVILIIDRDRSWQRYLRRNHGDRRPRRSPSWERRQIIYGALLVILGAAILLLLSAFNYLAGAISPPAPF